MTRREPFDLAETPLQPGTTLIEASAGTGKTFTLATLFLRLILERDWSVREILVVTFTEAATEELRGRIRERLAEAAAAFRARGKTEDEALRAMIRPHLSRSEAMLDRLDRALCGFDETPILTIHGFCQRTLRDRAFESGALFDTELLKDDSRLLEEIAEDFWRRHFYEAASLPVQFLLKNRYRPERFLPLLRLRNRHPMLEVISPVDHEKAEDLLARLERTFEQARDLWLTEEIQIRAAFGDAAWAKADYARPQMVEAKWSALAACFDDGARTPESLEALAFFALAALTKGTRSNDRTPVHSFFDLCQQVAESERDYLTGLDLEFLRFAAVELPLRKQQRKVVCFDDLLTRLQMALRGDGGIALAVEVRAKYRAALIDEFQDTDPVQAEIFRHLFVGSDVRTGIGDGGREDRGVGGVPKDANPSTPLLHPSTPFLFLIGDPKQAIYGFRGADIFTYLDAADAVDRRYTLGRNFRSESGLIRAVNTLFGSVAKPFLFDEIQFQPVDAGDRADQAPLRENGQSLPPMHFWFMPREGKAKEVTKEHAEAILPQVVAAEIARLLSSETRLGDVRLSPRDIAVLVPENRHARLMQEVLREWKIPSVLHTEESVFASREARHLERVLAAIARPANDRLIRAALATDLIGVNGTQLDQLTHDEARWQRYLERFLAYYGTWRDRGFMPMFRHWLQAEGVRQRLLQFADGERRLTNLLHLAEVLHQAEIERRLGFAGLVRWLSDQIMSDEKPADEHQIRLERDDLAVKLVTIHKSKGLEYPVVFYPFAWKSSDVKGGERQPVLFHKRSRADATGGETVTRLVCDLGTRDIKAHRELAVAEQLAENLRLLYVALTRARNRCYFVWGAFRGAGTSAAAWLLHPPEDGGNVRDAMNERFKSLSDAGMQSALQQLVERSTDRNGPPAIHWRPLPATEPQLYRPPGDAGEALQARVFTGRIARDWRILSFSALAADRIGESPDYDAAPEPEPGLIPAETVAEGIFAFPRGSNAGTCLHKIFEELDFNSGDELTLRTLVRAKLADHGFQPEAFTDTVCELVRRTLAVPLTAGCPEFVLAKIPEAERLKELEFFFPFSRPTPALLRSAFAGRNDSRELLAQLARLDFQPSAGFVKGFIDLVLRHNGRFYLVDWKSNWLGARLEDYGPAALKGEMTKNLYSLQYHLYTVALHRYLRQRVRNYDYESHFGGVRYLFLRGLDPMRPEFGVFAERPAGAWVEEFSAQLGGSEEP